MIQIVRISLPDLMVTSGLIFLSAQHGKLKIVIVGRQIKNVCWILYATLCPYKIFKQGGIDF
ncbi:hypothetical protein EGK75_11240 [Neisseria weixii]|uniref:Uncharacterized protein n=1 Tax=Neisseria weixii TaxID=1853276 RepID=A0A3N4MX13_9NEIS|nr:hypothetical protein EGK74_11190 [Neisseria weixii]RPD84872.1 hypothetical protein EGK75_11240 [Neisseria weixii]